MLSLYQTVVDKYPSYIPTILSTNNGTGSGVKDVVNTIPRLDRKEKIILCFDNDVAGEKLTERVAKLIGDKAHVIDLGNYKDANQKLTEDGPKGLLNDFYSVERYKPSGVITLSSLSEVITKDPEYGLDFPYPSLTEMTYGLRKSEIISIGAGAGQGKSVFITEMIKQLVFIHKENVGLFSLEETPEITGKKLIGSIMNKKIHLPGTEYDKDEAKEIINRISDSVYLYDHQGFIDWESIEAVIRFQATLGVGYFIIDPITALTSHLSSSETNEKLNKMWIVTGKP